MQNQLRAWIWGTLFAAIHLGAAHAANISDFADFSLLDTNGDVFLPGRLYIPPQAISNPDSPRPLILFLHGGGETGSDNTRQVNANIDNLLAAAKQRGAYLYAPQTISSWNSEWVTGDIMTMISRATTDLNADPDRLYVTGLSSGGGGTWTMLNRYPDKFAAGIPICGVAGASDFLPDNLLNTPVFVFHARNDVTVPVATSRNVFDSILTAAQQTLPNYPATGSGGDYFVSNPNLASHRTLQATIGRSRNVTNFFTTSSTLDAAYFEYATGGHAIFNTVYNQPAAYDWLFAHSLAVPEPSSLLLLTFAALVFTPVRYRFRRT